MNTQNRLSPASFIAHAADVAAFYGFRPMRQIEREVPRTERIRAAHSFGTTMQMCAAHLAQKPEEPVLAFFATPSPSAIPAAYAPRETAEFGLQVVGSPESLGEVIVLKTLFAIITEWGASVARVRINALGERDSKIRFERELVAYLRKRHAALCEACRNALSAAPLGTYACVNDACREVLADGPRAMNFLAEKSRAHFREVLEYIESIGLPYDLDDLLVGDEREQHIVFAIDLSEDDATILGGRGGRYDDYVRSLSPKKDSAAVSASVFFRKKGASRGSYRIAASSAQPKVYFVQLGTRAKLQGLAVLDALRAAHVPVSQSFDAKSLGPQLACARQLGVPYLLIMGQREALDGTVIVRSMQNSSQTIVPVATLPRYLKSLR